MLDSRHVSQNAISPLPLDQVTHVFSPCVWPGITVRGGRKRKKLVWKLAVLKAVGGKGGERCYRTVVAPSAENRSKRKNTAIQED